MQFEFATATRIIFGEGSFSKIGSLSAEVGRRAFVATGLDRPRGEAIHDILLSAKVDCVLFPVQGEPTVELIYSGIALAQQSECDMVIGFGGGSAIDCGKAIAALLSNPGLVLDYLEVIGRGKPIVERPAPLIAIPTTSGTGAEVTRNAVLGSPQHKMKVSLRSPLMLPRLALVDPELTYSLPPSITASTGLDALTQLIEPFVCNQTNPITDAICREGLRHAAHSLRTAFDRGDDPAARRGMSLASLMGGLALANARLGAVHGFASPLGGMLPAPHGAVCARLLPLVMEVNLRGLRQRLPGSEIIQRYEEISRILKDRADATAEDGVAWVRELCEHFFIPGLAAYGLTHKELPELIENSAKASSMKGNPVILTQGEMEEILTRAM
jgi:alcohol dehydrogenase class IV